jgi:hypothetical protein
MVRVTAAGSLKWTLIACVVVFCRVTNNARHFGYGHISPNRVVIPGVRGRGFKESGSHGGIEFSISDHCHPFFARVMVGHGFPRALK